MCREGRGRIYLRGLQSFLDVDPNDLNRRTAEPLFGFIALMMLSSRLFYTGQTGVAHTCEEPLELRLEIKDY